MTWTDSHAHLTSDRVFDDVDAMLLRAEEAGVSRIINICTDAVTLERGIVLQRKYPWVYNVAATTPHDVVKEGETFFPLVKKAARGGELVGIGETGLDYYYEHSERSVQQRFLRRYLRLAKEIQLPVVIHCRDAFADFFSILDEEAPGHPGVLHCFTGTVEEAHQVIQRGWYLSLSGIVTFKKSEELRQVAQEIPIEQLLLETDTPYLAPVPYRGKVNEPAYVVHTARCIAERKGISLQSLAESTRRNAKALFQIPD